MNNNAQNVKGKVAISTADACRDVGHMLVAKYFVNKSYSLTLDKYVGSSFFNKICIKMDIITEPDYCPPTSFYKDCYELSYSKEQLCQAVSVLLGGLTAQNIVLGGSYDNCIDNISYIRRILQFAVNNGMFGIDVLIENMYNPYDDRHDFQNISPYFSEKKARLNAMLISVTSQCYNQACDILKGKKQLIENLMYSYIDATHLSKRQIDEIIAQHERETIDQIYSNC